MKIIALTYAVTGWNKSAFLCFAITKLKKTVKNEII